MKAKGPLACLVDSAIQADSHEGWQIVVIGAVEEEKTKTALLGYCELDTLAMVEIFRDFKK